MDEEVRTVFFLKNTFIPAYLSPNAKNSNIVSVLILAEKDCKSEQIVYLSRLELFWLALILFVLFLYH